MLDCENDNFSIFNIKEKENNISKLLSKFKFISYSFYNLKIKLLPIIIKYLFTSTFFCKWKYLQSKILFNDLTSFTCLLI